MVNDAQARPPRWYSNPYVVGGLLVFFFPAGLYLMWRYGVWSRAARLAVTGVVALIVVMASTVDGGTSESDSDDDDTRVTAAPEVATSAPDSIAGETQPASPSTSPAIETAAPSLQFDTAWVRALIMKNEQLGGLAEVHFVTAEADLAEADRACVDLYLDGNSAAFCFGFGSDADFEFAEVDRETGGMKRLCWKAREGQPLAGPDFRDGSTDNVVYELHGCPGGG